MVNLKSRESTNLNFIEGTHVKGNIISGIAVLSTNFLSLHHKQIHKREVRVHTTQAPHRTIDIGEYL